MRINYGLVINTIGMLNIICGLFMWVALPFSFYYREGDTLGIFLAGLITLILGGSAWLGTRKIKHPELRKKDGYLIVSLGWISMSLVGSLPYLLTGSIPNLTDAFFESVSGLTTTGASIFEDIEAVGKGVLVWRSLTQWIGGMGIIVLAVAILPILGIGGTQLFVAEVSGISFDKLKPRIKDVAKRLWYIYLGLTLTNLTLLLAGGMSFYDAFNHCLTTMSSGGFSTKNASMGHFDSPFIHYVTIFFMICSGVNFTLLYFIFKGKMVKVWKNEEFRFYLSIVGILTVLATLILWLLLEIGLERSFREAFFQVVSIITTTGFATADYTAWTPFLTFMFFLLMFTGACAGSTSGGIKLVRHLILFKNSGLELKRQVHPSAVLPVRLNGKAIPMEITYNIQAFIIIYLSIFALGTGLLSALGVDFVTSLGATATSLGNVGPGIGKVGPANNFAYLPDLGKWYLGFLMLLGRLELFTVLMLFNPYFWKKI